MCRPRPRHDANIRLIQPRADRIGAHTRHDERLVIREVTLALLDQREARLGLLNERSTASRLAGIKLCREV